MTMITGATCAEPTNGTLVPAAESHSLPAGLVLYRRAVESSLDNASDFSLIRDLEDFSPVPDAGTPGRDIVIALFSEEAHSQAFRYGFQLGCPDDDVSYLGEWVAPLSGGPVYAVIVLFGDSDDDALKVQDYRAAGK